MHIIIGLLGSIVTVLWLLHRLAEMGIDLGGLNPWLWKRRRKWKKQYEANPIYGLDTPMEATALVVTATAKADGDITSEEKHEILHMFESEFHLSKRDAAGLLVSSTYLLGKGDEVRDDLSSVLAPSLTSFSPEQADSAIALIARIGKVGGGVTHAQADFIQGVEDLLGRIAEPKGKWG
ncbi:MAG: TerB family tellurite resistance protein [Xanthomonadales bacterium]|nr:TerB family tellurite resistance protein [Xanthomonadales bacterium]